MIEKIHEQIRLLQDKYDITVKFTVSIVYVGAIRQIELNKKNSKDYNTIKHGMSTQQTYEYLQSIIEKEKIEHSIHLD